LGESLPPGYREREIAATDLLPDYRGVPERCHGTGGKEMGLAAHAERFFFALCQRCACFVWRTLSFSRVEENHVRALGYFFRPYSPRILWVTTLDFRAAYKKASNMLTHPGTILDRPNVSGTSEMFVGAVIALLRRKE
jgi:hypothetical protein